MWTVGTLTEPLPWNGLTILTALILVYFTFTVFSRLVFHPLRHFPGPRLASLTIWYTAYYDLVKDGGIVEHLEGLHEKFGPVVRIAPDELHFSDPRAYASIYSQGSKFIKYPTFYQCFGEDESSLGYTDPHLAKVRRDIIMPLFSRRAILKLENVVQQKIDTLITQILSYKSGEPLSMYLAFRSTTLDIITSYCFSRCHDCINFPGFRHPILISLDNFIPMPFIFKYFPFVQHFLLSLPDWVTLRLTPSAQGFVDIRREMEAEIDQFIADPSLLEHADHEIVYHHLMMPQAEKGQYNIPSKKSLLEEAINLMIAGTDTVGNACTIGTFYTLNDKAVHDKLIQELVGAWPDKDMKIGLEILEKLPYLTAVIKESLRMAHGVVSGLPRVVGPTSAQIAGINVPAGAAVSIGATFIHCNPDIFPNPTAFSPERWLQPNSRELESYLVSFSRGPRSCAGINLAWCELYLILGNVFRKVDVEIFETTVDDFKFRAFFLPVFRGNQFHAHTKERAV